MITPTADGILIDCKGDHRLWGCGCEHCIHRDHPMDRGTRIARAQLIRWAELSSAIDRTVTRACLPCGSTDTRLYPGGWYCDQHKPGRTE